jgi:hypothetical protein
MKIKKILYQSRRDLNLELVCEHCGDVTIDIGYDDENYHNIVIPGMICKVCNKKASDDYIPLIPKYNSWEII